MIISVADRVENIVGRGENADYQHSLLLPQCFEKVSFPDKSKAVIEWELVNADNKINETCKTEILFWMGRKHCRKRRKCW